MQTLGILIGLIGSVAFVGISGRWLINVLNDANGGQVR